MDDERVRNAVEVLLNEVGEDPTREGLARTPTRVAKALQFLTSGYESIFAIITRSNKNYYRTFIQEIHVVSNTFCKS